MTQDNHKDLTGVNLLYLAPEYFQGSKCTWKTDTWSIGTILYLLITGGVEDTGRRCTHKEPRDFREPIWYNLQSFVLDFMKRMIQANPDERATLEELLAHPFMRKYKGGELKHVQLEETTPGGSNFRMYKFYIAYLVSEIV